MFNKFFLSSLFYTFFWFYGEVLMLVSLVSATRGNVEGQMVVVHGGTVGAGDEFCSLNREREIENG